MENYFTAAPKSQVEPDRRNINACEAIEVHLDLETTGLSPKDSHVIQISARTSGEEAVQFSSFVRVRTLPEKIKQLTGITDEQVRTAPDPREVLLSFFEFIRQVGKDRSVILVAYNGFNFDFRFLYSSCTRTSLNFFELCRNSHVVRLADPIVWARQHADRSTLPRTKFGNCSFALMNLYMSYFHAPFSGAHNADNDTLAMLAICDAARGTNSNDWNPTQDSMYSMDIVAYKGNIQAYFHPTKESKTKKRKASSSSTKSAPKSKFSATESAMAVPFSTGTTSTTAVLSDITTENLIDYPACERLMIPKVTVAKTLAFLRSRY